MGRTVLGHTWRIPYADGAGARPQLDRVTVFFSSEVGPRSAGQRAPPAAWGAEPASGVVSRYLTS
jgi:hypothetical protein